MKSRGSGPIAEGRLDERDLLARLRAGDRTAERAFYDLHVERIYRLAYRMTRDDTMARDMTQDAFVRAFERLPGFRGESALSTWLYAIGVSVILNGLRKVKRLQQHETALEAAEHAADPRSPADPSLRDRVQRAVDRLSGRYRTVLVMHDVEGYKHEEIAAILGIPTGTSKARLSRARAWLREDLTRNPLRGTR